MSFRSPRSSKFPPNSQRGFSLLEIMVAVGVLGIITYGIVTFMKESGKQAASVASKTDFNSLVNELQGVFNNAASCMVALGEVKDPATGAVTTPAVKINTDVGRDTDLPPNNKPQAVKLKIGKDTSTILYEAGTKYGKGLTITKLQFVGATEVSSGQWKVVLELHTSRRLSDKAGSETAAGGDLLRPHVFNLLVAFKSPSDRTVTRCSGQYSNYWVEGHHPDPDHPKPNNGFPIAYVGGFVGLGPGMETPEQMLDVAGTAQADAFLYRSDARLKDNVREIPEALERVLRLRGVLYDWKARHDLPQGENQLGFLAQDVEKEFPEAVVTNPSTGMKSVAYANLMAPLLEAVKAQQKLLERQQREIEELKRALRKE